MDPWDLYRSDMRFKAQFVSSPVREPATGLLSLLGSGMFLAARRWRKSRP